MRDTQKQPAFDNNNKNSPRTLERLLAHYARKTPTQAALADPPNRAALEGAPRDDDGDDDNNGDDGEADGGDYNFGELNQAVERMTRRFSAMQLDEGDYVAVQMPNISDSLIVVLALMRARLTPCLLPMKWSIGEVDRSCARLKLRALVSCGSFEGVDHSEIMRELAFRHVNVRFVLGLSGSGRLAEGVENLTPVLRPANPEDAPLAEQRQTPEAAVGELALVTFLDPVTPVPWTHGQLLTSGLMQLLTASLGSKDHMLCAYPPSSATGLCAFIAPWLICGCRLELHQPFHVDSMLRQLQSGEVSYMAAPSELIEWVVQSPLPTPKKLGLAWRSGEAAHSSLTSPEGVELFDVWSVADMGVICARRENDQPAPLFPQAMLRLPGDEPKRLCVAAAKTKEGGLLVRGRIFPSTRLLEDGLEWFSLKKRLKGEFLDTGLHAIQTTNDDIHLAAEADEMKMVGS